MTSVKELSMQLARQDTQQYTLLRLLQLAASGNDVSSSAEQVVRYCLQSSSANSPTVLSLAFDVLNSSPAHPHWSDALGVLMDHIRANDIAICAAALSKVPPLPHSALQHMALYCTTPICDALQRKDSTKIRQAAVRAACAFVLRERPLTAPVLDAVRVSALPPRADEVLRVAASRALHALVDATADTDDAVATEALSALTGFATQADAQHRPRCVLTATRDATADTVWMLLQGRLSRLTKRFEHLIRTKRGRYQRTAIIAMSQFAARSVARVPPGRTSTDESDATTQWATRFVSSVLEPLCVSSDTWVAGAACGSLLHICASAGGGTSPDRVAKWGTHGVSRIAQLLRDRQEELAPLVIAALVQDATRALAALSKNEFVNRSFVVSSGDGLLAHASRCQRAALRVEAISVIAATVIEFDLAARDHAPGACLSAITRSAAWKHVLADVDVEDGADRRAEVVCCFALALMDASRKIAECGAPKLREDLTDIWATMLANLIRATLPCLTWPSTSSSAYAKQLFLKMFEALGQYSAFIFRRRGVGMEEYEQIQEAMVKATLVQKDVDTRSALLTCITKYWLASGLKAESNAGHVLKAIWNHAQEHFRDEEIMLNELRVGASWSDAKTGESTPAQRAVEGGYISAATALSKRTRAIAGTVGATLTTALEETLFGSIALRTSAAEGSTLTTDYAYVVLASGLALVHHNPRIAGRTIAIMNQYRDLLSKAQSSDLLVDESIRNTISALEMYQDEFFPKEIPIRALPTNDRVASNPLVWLTRVTESCVYATSRVDDPEIEAGTVSTEESMLRAAASVRRQMKGFNLATLRGTTFGTQDVVESDSQTLNGTADPFSVVASHSMDTVKGLALLRVSVTNRSAHAVQQSSLLCSASGALAPLPDSPGELPLGTLDVGASTVQRVTFAVRYNHGFAGRVFLRVFVRGDKHDVGAANTFAEQPCVPYHVPSSDVLLLRAPTAGAGVDVFRRRWDLMRAQTTFHVVIGRSQSVDSLVDVLQRRSRCLREVGRMRLYSHVSTLVADSSRADYIAMAIVAPEATGVRGNGACIAYVHIRSNSHGYSSAFRSECRDWLKSTYKVIIADELEHGADKRFALKPQDSFFITEGGGLSAYQRWRRAHADRMSN